MEPGKFQLPPPAGTRLSLAQQMRILGVTNHPKRCGYETMDVIDLCGAYGSPKPNRSFAPTYLEC